MSESEAAVEHELLALLRGRTGALCERWHGELIEHLDVRPQSIFPGDELLDHMPLVIQWLGRSIARDEEVDPESMDALRQTARHWRDAGYTIEESLTHFRVLSRILHEELRRISSDVDGNLEPARAARMSEQLSHGIMLVQSILVATYRDEEEKRLEQLAEALAHEIRNPLGAALTGLESVGLLEEEITGRGRGGDAAEPRDPPAAEWTPEEVRRRRDRILERVEHSLRHADRMIEVVRQFGSVGESRERRRPLVDIVRIVIDDLDPEGASVEVECAEGWADVLVPEDPVHLALHNLVQNALRHAGGEDRPARVRISCTRDDECGEWRVAVEDDGPGIEEEERETIFRKFRRGRRARASGFGLGLSIVRAAALRIGGRVSLDTEVERGSTFTFAVPFDQVREGGDASG